MKKRISVTLSADLVSEIDRKIGPDGSRSAFIETELTRHIQKLERDEISARDFELINANADRLNAEAEDVLQYQADPFEPETLTYQEALDLKLIVVPLSPADVVK
jgi:metal-responsive CopG/Arc/MetJ family transcriptional regulator